MFLIFSLQHLQRATDSYLFYGDGPFVVDILKEMTSKWKKKDNIFKLKYVEENTGIYTGKKVLQKS
jgi:hypothetical protein